MGGRLKSCISTNDCPTELARTLLPITRRGDSLIITDRGVPIGRIVPIGQDLGQRLEAMRETGLPQGSGHKLRRRRPVAKLRGQGSVARLLVEDRG